MMNQAQTLSNYEDNVSSTKDSDCDYIPKRASCKKNTRKIHKIPLDQQELLFSRVFNDGKTIKEVAQTLHLNYSSAKSLIHYYKKQKRPAPQVIAEVLNSQNTPRFRMLTNIKQFYNNLKIEVRENNCLLNSYYYFEHLEDQKQ